MEVDFQFVNVHKFRNVSKYPNIIVFQNYETFNNLAHREFTEWVENKIGINRREAYKFMKVAKDIPNDSTFSQLETSALYLITTLPEDEKQAQLEKIEKGESPTVRELQDLKRKLKESEERNKRLAEQVNFQMVRRRTI